MSKSLEDLMNMSDEEIAGLVTVPGETDSATPDEDTNTDQTDTPEQEDIPSGSTEGESDDSGDEDQDEDKDDEDESDGSDDVADAQSDSKSDAKPEAGKPAQGKDKPKPDAKDAKDKGTEKPDQKADAKAVNPKAKDNQVEAPDYEKLYKEIMKPFKANGRTININSPDEAVQLMQMGANYTKKMQALQPNLKVLKMLENNQLLDESKLSHLIDIARGDKGAIAKLVKDSGIDPMDMDDETAVNYKAGNHRVSDSEISFAQVVEDTASTEHGAELIVQMNHVWDQTSKKAIFKEPELIRVLAAQKANGIYDQIAEVIEKKRVLGDPQIANLPFIQAYQVIGDAMQAQGLLNPRGGSNPPQGQPQNQTQELGRAPAPRKKAVANDAKAKAASPSGNSTKTAKPFINPLEMSDEDFLKWADRV